MTSACSSTVSSTSYIYMLIQLLLQQQGTLAAIHNRPVNITSDNGTV